MEDALRENLSSVLSDAADDQAVNGSGTADGTINGLIAILANPDGTPRRLWKLSSDTTRRC